MTDRTWTEGWEHILYRDGAKVTGTPRRPDLKPIITWHCTAGVFHQLQTLIQFAVHDIATPVAYWYADPDTTAWDYEKFGKWDGARKLDVSGNPVRARKGFEKKLQTLPAEWVSWGLRGVGKVVRAALRLKGIKRPETNHRGRIHLQIEDMAYASDAGHFTEDELYRRGLVMKDMSLTIMRMTDEDFVPATALDVLPAYPASAGKKSGFRHPWPVWMSDVISTVQAHSLIPGQTHGDPGALAMGKICEIARHELNQTLEVGSPSQQAAKRAAQPVAVDYSPMIDLMTSIQNNMLSATKQMSKDIDSVLKEISKLEKSPSKKGKQQ